MLRQLTERGGGGGRHRPGRARTPASPFHVKRAETSAPVDSAAGPHSRSRWTTARCTRVDGCRRSSACTAAHVVSDRRIPGSAWRPRAQVSHLSSRVMRVPGRGSGSRLPRVLRRQGRWGRGRTGQLLRSTRRALASAGGWGVDARGTAARSDPGMGCVRAACSRVRARGRAGAPRTGRDVDAGTLVAWAQAGCPGGRGRAAESAPRRGRYRCLEDAAACGVPSSCAAQRRAGRPRADAGVVHSSQESCGQLSPSS